MHIFGNPVIGINMVGTSDIYIIDLISFIQKDNNNKKRSKFQAE